MSAPTRADIDRRCSLTVEQQIRGVGLLVMVDTREQSPYLFEQYDCRLVHGTLPTGDYTIAGLENHVAIERKSLDDLISCLMGNDRKRFERELSRLRGYEMGAVVIEAALEDVRKHHYRSRMRPHAALQSVFTFQVRYGVPFVWAGSREGAEYVTYGLLSKYLREADLQYRAISSNYGLRRTG